VDGLQRSDRQRLLKVSALFQSPHDGERLAALETFSRLLRTAGADWADLIGLPALPAPDNAKTEDGGPTPQPLSVAELARLARLGRGVLTPWEQSFLVGISTQRRLSPKQQGMLRDIRRKVSTAEAVRGAAA
jgi:hypothetical protein